MKKKKLNIDQNYSISDTNPEFNNDINANELIDLPVEGFDDVYDDLDFMDQYKDASEEDDPYAGQ